MKNIALLIVTLFLVTGAFAQRNAPPPTYDENNGETARDGSNVFAGGSLSLGFGSYTFNVGGNPEVGVTVSQWLDLGLALNLNYYSQRADDQGFYNDNTRFRSFNYGGGIFARAYPVRFLFVQAQPELNWVHYSSKSFATDYSTSGTVNSASFIAGVGYTQRIVGEGSYFLMIGLDLLNNKYSPYRDSYSGAQLPVIRAGFDFYFHKKRKN